MSRKMSRATVVRTNSRNRVVMSMLYTCKGKKRQVRRRADGREVRDIKVKGLDTYVNDRGQVCEVRRVFYEGQIIQVKKTGV